MQNFLGNPTAGSREIAQAICVDCKLMYKQDKRRWQRKNPIPVKESKMKLFKDGTVSFFSHLLDSQPDNCLLPAISTSHVFA
jgi:hypothetical protein